MRHWFVRGPLIGLLAIVFLLPGQNAGAVLDWCKSDPVVDIGDKRTHVYVAGPTDLLRAVTGPTVVEITVPVGVPLTVISTDNGFGSGWEVRVAESDTLPVTRSGFTVTVRTFVPASLRLPVSTEVTDGNDVVLGQITGATNTWNTVTLRV